MNVQCVCIECNGTNVSVQAKMVWFPRQQKFVVADFIDDSWVCEDCGRHVDVEQVEYTGEVES